MSVFIKAPGLADRDLARSPGRPFVTPIHGNLPNTWQLPEAASGVIEHRCDWQCDRAGMSLGVTNGPMGPPCADAKGCHLVTSFFENRGQQQ